MVTSLGNVLPLTLVLSDIHSSKNVQSRRILRSQIPSTTEISRHPRGDKKRDIPTYPMLHGQKRCGLLVLILNRISSPLTANLVWFRIRNFSLLQRRRRLHWTPDHLKAQMRRTRKGRSRLINGYGIPKTWWTKQSFQML
jgi:hypothetical protein